ncbi:hypothetical protein COU60_03095 [Candidatus Pacearchaeota archaeon CG10_big_fil_rev_8_21_14_0_10_34_76]|nr:MAG: hypothetical protein COU60_03095 [Candidatus Pacearchaeota archaeon CG10_big_fil_rev_8_21_14_0_10_34_76]
MRKKDVKGIIHDLLRYLEWRNPLHNLKFPGKIKVNLLSKEVIGIGEDSLWKMYHEKIEWFHWRLNQLNANLEDFTKARITISGTTEKVEIIYKGENFTDKISFQPY